MDKSFSADARHEAYVLSLLGQEDVDLAEIRERSLRFGLPQIHLAKTDARHLEVLCQLVKPLKAVEVGTLAGYSGVCLSRGLAPEGKLYTFEFDSKHAAVARETFRLRGLQDRIELIEGPAQNGLDGIESEGPFDFIFIDADKTGYPAYLEWATRNVRDGGMLVADNTFAWGLIDQQIYPDAATHEKVEALRLFNRSIFESDSWRATFLPTGEGLIVAVRQKR